MTIHSHPMNLLGWLLLLCPLGRIVEMRRQSSVNVAPPYGAIGSTMRESSAVQVVGGPAGLYQIPNIYGGGLGCELVVHMWSTVGATSAAILDFDGMYAAAPAALPTITRPQRAVVLANAQGAAVPMGPLVSQATDNVQLAVVSGSVWIVYQWARIVPDPEANAVETAADATRELTHKKGCNCHCFEGRIG